jgi:hypothetical protein
MWDLMLIVWRTAVEGVVTTGAEPVREALEEEEEDAEEFSPSTSGLASMAVGRRGIEQQLRMGGIGGQTGGRGT